MKKIIFVSDIIASELASLNSLYKAENTCKRETKPEQTALRYCISLKETLFISVAFAVINKHAKRGVTQASTVFGFPNHVACRRIL